MGDRAHDRAAIARVFAEHERAFNENDAELLTAGWRERSWWVDAAGVELEGREAMRARADSGDQRARYEPGELEFLGDDVAISHLYVHAVDAFGEPIDVGHTLVALYVFAREDGAWKVVARQDTLRAPGR